MQQRPAITPDQVKALLTSTAQPLPVADPVAQGSGLLDLKRARDTATPQARQTWPRATGLGSLELARGSAHVEAAAGVVSGEVDVRGRAWDAAAWSGDALAGLTWNGITWNGITWNATSWGGDGSAAALPTVETTTESTLETTWSGKTWSGKTWSGKTWSGAGWDSD